MELKVDQVGRIPAPGDNVAIASRLLEPGTRIRHAGARYKISDTVMEGHRFAHTAIAKGRALLSWGLPFGTASRDIAPGEYVFNTKMLAMLATRHIDFALSKSANFVDHYVRYEFDERDVNVGRQVERYVAPRFFDGFSRGARRGVGTRNYVVILGTSSISASYARALANRFRDQRDEHMDGVVPVAHTEGGEGRPNNLDLLLRTLSGLVVHPNVGAVLVVDFGDEAVNNATLKHFMTEHDYPLDDVRHRLVSLNPKTSLEVALDEGEAVVRSWLDPVHACRRTKQSVEHLKIALQCGGSDAFSGVSGNPLAGWVAKETIRCGGLANLAETDELIGAEKYVLNNVRHLDVAHAFLDKIESFKKLAGRHGHDAEGNTSGGNFFRGLYNIAIKSIGAARKRDPQVRLDHVIDYGEPMREGGFYFMDSPGNDLESIAGQVASGANLILFTTGNGSITNFPFVPTIKIITTTGRYNLIRREMDVNAGRYQEGMPMDELGAETFDLALRIASGQRSVGEKAGHSQVQIWRNWRQTEPNCYQKIHDAPEPTGQPVAIQSSRCSDATFNAYRTLTGYAADQVGVIVPTSLCSGQIARLIVERLNDQAPHPNGLSRFVTFVHTEGCGVSSGDNEEQYVRTLIGHIAHPMVKCGLFLEHGCEKTHNDAMRDCLVQLGVKPSRFGWASVQLDGGIESVTDKVIRWFDQSPTAKDDLVSEDVKLDHLRLAVTVVGVAPTPVAASLAQLVATVVGSGGIVVVPGNTSLLEHDVFLNELAFSSPIHPTLAYGQRAEQAGFHIMDTPTQHTAETLTGLGATGVDVMIAHVMRRAIQTHPMIPLLQYSSQSEVPDMDLRFDSRISAAAVADALLERVLLVASRQYTPTLFGQGYTDFQMTRGLLGISL